MDNPIPEHVGGIKTVLLGLSALGTAYALSRAEPVHPVRAGINAIVAFACGVLAGYACLDNFPEQKALSMAGAILVAAICVPLIPVIQETAAENIRKLRFPWSKE
ncbi:hypothetical protein [Massilia sp. METH4]|uniref:hypothetical protein n=1 Tax=Massilia sp. METH4 TaxID=3123041 RepID=UPI0030D40951